MAKLSNFSQSIKPTREEILKIRFWDKNDVQGVFNLDRTKYDNLDEFADKFNERLKTQKIWKGRLNEARKSTYRKIIYMLADQMEQMRHENPDKYLFYLSDEFDSIPLFCNRMDIVRLCKGAISPKTAYNHVQFLLDVQIDGKKLIVSKHATSRVRIDGNIIRIANGRGDFQLWIPKNMLDFNIDVSQFLKTEKSRLEGNQRQNLPQNKLNIKKRTRKNINDNPADAQYGVATQQFDFLTALCADNEERRNEGGNKTGLENQTLVEEKIKTNFSPAARREIDENAPKNNKNEQGGMPENPVNKGFEVNVDPGADFAGTPSDLTKIIPEILDFVEPDKPKTKLELYYEKINRSDRIDRVLPRNSMELAVFLLCGMLRKMVYPNLSDNYWNRIAGDVGCMLQTHMERLQDRGYTDNVWKAMALVSRGIFLVYRELQSKPDKYPGGQMKYAPLPFLRVDLEYGWFKTVMDKWVTNENRRLTHLVSENSQFAGWQAAYAESEYLFAKVVREMRYDPQQSGSSRYARAMTKASESILVVKALAKKYGLKDATTQKVVASFIARIQAIRRTLIENDENKHLQDWDTFYNEFQKNVV